MSAVTDALARHVRAARLVEDTAVERILRAVPPRAQAVHWGKLSGVEPADPQALRAAIGDRRLVVSLSHDSYRTIVGGVQNCVSREEQAFTARGWRYLHLCPYQPLPMLADPAPAAEFPVLCTVDGAVIGVLTLDAVIEAVIAAAGVGGSPRLMVIHHLLGHCPELVADLVAALKPDTVYFWTHDLFAHCPSIHLLRNDVNFCGGPPVGSGACAVCHAGTERTLHVDRFAAFFARVRPHLLSPSQTILAKWRHVHPYPDGGATVIPPCHFDPGEAVVPEPGGRLKIGFLGAPFFHKGWDAFESLALWFEDDERYEFHQLGFHSANAPCITFHKVEVTRDDPDAMVRAVTELGIDVAINWSRCYESFSFTAMEAIAGGAFLVARRGAGNVGPLLAALDPALGLEIGDAIELQALFADGGIDELARAAPRRYGTMTAGIGAATLVDAA